MGFKLGMELEHGKQPSWFATELHVRARVQDAWGWVEMLVPACWVQSRSGTHSSVVKQTRRRKMPLAF